MVERDFAGTDRFEVRRRLGQGGMGVVYEAFDRVRVSSVALKTLNRFDPQAIYRMKQEFRALTDVSHPNLAQLYELVFANEQWFFTMELVDGVDFLSYVRGHGAYEMAARPAEVLGPAASVGAAESSAAAAPTSSIDDETWLRVTDPTERMTWDNRAGELFSTSRTLLSVEATIPKLEPRAVRPGRRVSTPRALGPVGVERTRETLRQLAEGMIALHDAGKLHRDIKPSNVMVTKTGRVVLLDFGLVTEMYEKWLIQSTMEGALVGTVAYMAPEQSVGAILGPACDWYSVGVMLFEALTACLPFEGKLFEILLDKQELDAPLARDLVPEVPDDLNRLCRDLLRRNPDDRPSGREVLKRLRATATPGTGPTPSWKTPAMSSKLIGRRRELAALDRAFDTAAHGGTVIVHLHGRSGIGKTALVREFLEKKSAAQAIVLSGRCYERELVPYKALDNVIDALSHHLRKIPKKDARDLLSDDIRSLVRVFPVLKRVDVIHEMALVAGAGAPSVPVEVRRRALGALRDLLDRLAKRRPVVIAIDDLHWGDEDSALLLQELLRPPHPPELLMIAIYRSEGADVSPVVRALRAEPGSVLQGLDVRELSVGPLDRSEAEDLARTILAHVVDETTDSKVAAFRAGSDTDPGIKAQEIARESRGNPFLVHELASFAHAEIRNASARYGEAMPDSREIEINLDRAIQARIKGLPGDARRLVEIVAVASRPIAESIAFRAAQIAPGDRTPIALLTSAHLVRAIHSALREPLVEPYHHGAVEAVKAMLGPEELREHHRALAAALEAEEHADPEALVHHLRAAGERQRAADLAVLAAERAVDVLAFDRAASLFRLAIDLADETKRPEVELYSALGEALVNAGHAWDAAEAFVRAAKSTDPPRGRELHRRAAEQLLRSGHVERGVALMREVLAGVGASYPESTPAAVRRVKLERAKLLVTGLKLPAIGGPSGRKPRAEEIERLDALWAASMGLAMVDFTRGMYFHNQALPLALKLNDPYRRARSLAIEAALTAGLEGNDERAKRVLVHLRELVAGLNHPHAKGLCAMAHAFAAYFSGRVREAIGEGDRALAILSTECTGAGWELDTTRAVLYGAMTYVGDLASLPTRLREEIRLARLSNNLYAVAVVVASPSVSTLWLAHDRVDYARSQLEASLAEWPMPKDDLFLQGVQSRLSEASFDLYQGEATRAYARLRAEWQRIEASMAMRIRLVQIEAHYTRARVALAAARDAPQGREKMIRIAKSDAKRIFATGMSFGRPFAISVEAGVAAIEGDRSKALLKLAEAEKLFLEHDVLLYRAACMRIRGELIGGSEGAALVEQADAWLRAASVVDPERMARALSALDPRA
jgi:eukaryotic-like serine/threonine-protein kinase